jgi:hypothetical protein
MAPKAVIIKPEHIEVVVKLEGNDDIKLKVRELLLLLFIVIVNKIVLLFT